LFVAANTERAVPGQVSRQVDVDESANELRKRAKGLDWVQVVDRLDDADLVVTLTGRRKDPNRGFVLSYILEAGAHKVEDEFASAGGTEITGGTRALGSDGRTNYEGRQSRSWEGPGQAVRQVGGELRQGQLRSDSPSARTAVAALQREGVSRAEHRRMRTISLRRSAFAQDHEA
jgi:hypothetical protein